MRIVQKDARTWHSANRRYTPFLVRAGLVGQLWLSLGGCGSSPDPTPPATSPAETAPNESTPGTATPGTATPGTSTPGTSTPGTSTPGTSTPGTSTPGTATPGTATPGTATPGTATPDTSTPATNTPPVTPTLPPATPTLPPTPTPGPEPFIWLELSEQEEPYLTEPGEEAVQVYSIQNLGTVALEVIDSSVADPEFTLQPLWVGDFPVILLPGESVEEEVWFAPSAPGTYETVLDAMATEYPSSVPSMTIVSVVLLGEARVCALDPLGDSDADEVCDSEDSCPGAANPDQQDTDGDGLGDACDACPLDLENDADQDGVCERTDNCPTQANADQANQDGDAQGDACDPCSADAQNDADQDGICGNVDLCPTTADPTQADTDQDGKGNACDACPADPLNDVDGDGVCGDLDNCPTTGNASQSDLDGDETGDACDTCPGDPDDDLDQDGICGDLDNCIDDPNTSQSDLDGDGRGDACDVCASDPLDDADSDGVCGDIDNCPTTANTPQTDTDLNGVGDACDSEVCDGLDNNGNGQLDEGFADSDADSRADCVDACPQDAQNDADADTVCGNVDNCPTSPNQTQANADGDALGDACDLCARDSDNDVDADGLCGDVDNCPSTSNSGQDDTDGDLAGDACDTCAFDAQNDADRDGVCGDVDNCPSVANTTQTNADGDTPGDACDTCAHDAQNDADRDGVCGDVDNCPSLSNPTQGNSDGDSLGDVCDSEDCDGVDNDGDTQVDEGFTNTDGDAQANCVDADDDNDSVADSTDLDPLDPLSCTDADQDTCDDCSQSGQPSPGSDGADSDADGICNLGDTNAGSSQSQAGTTCATIKLQYPSSTDGVYWIDPDSGATTNAFQVFCDMTTDGGGWILVARMGESTTHASVNAMDSDTNLSSMLTGAAPTGNLWAHFNLARFNSFGSAWTVRSRVDSNNNSSHYQYVFFQPKQGGSCTPGQAGANWRGTDTRSRLVYLNRTTTSGSTNTTWLPVERFDDVSSGQPSIYLFGHRRTDLTSSTNCLSSASQTQLCHAPAMISNESSNAGTMTAAYSMGDGIPHAWNKRGSWWLRETSSIRNGSSQLAPAASCKALYQAGIRSNGLYWIDLDGGSTSNAYQVYCDLSTDGGGWTLGVNITSDLGPINLFVYDNRTADPLNTNYGVNLSTQGLASSTEYRLTCVESSDSTSRKLFITGLVPTEPIFQAAGTITKTNIRCSQSPDFSNAYTGNNCIIGGYDDDNHTYYGNAAWDMDWALYKLGSAYTLRHCANRGNGYFNRGMLWYR